MNLEAVFMGIEEANVNFRILSVRETLFKKKNANAKEQSQVKGSWDPSESALPPKAESSAWQGEWVKLSKRL